MGLYGELNSWPHVSLSDWLLSVSLSFFSAIYKQLHYTVKKMGNMEEITCKVQMTNASLIYD